MNQVKRRNKKKHRDDGKIAAQSASAHILVSLLAFFSLFLFSRLITTSYSYLHIFLQIKAVSYAFSYPSIFFRFVLAFLR